MKLYHGSKNKVEKLKKHQAGAKEDAAIPPEELLDAIYFTSDYPFAVLSAVRPHGLMESDEKKRMVKFEHPELFDPQQDIFIYSIESEDIPLENLKQIDAFQFAIIDMDELKPKGVEQMKAIEVTKYYKIENWREKTKEINSDFRVK